MAAAAGDAAREVWEVPGSAVRGLVASRASAARRAPSSNLKTDPEHCGSCTNACDTGIDCMDGVCVTAPCVGITCSTVKTLTFASGDGYRADDIGVDDRLLRKHTAYPQAVAPKTPAIISWEFVSPRKLEVNGVQVLSNEANGSALGMPLRAGGYCIHVSAGDHDYAGLKLPVPSTLP